MLTYFLVCPAAIEADSSVNFNAALSLPKNTNRNNITERNGGGKKAFSEQCCCETCNHAHCHGAAAVL